MASFACKPPSTLPSSFFFFHMFRVLIFIPPFAFRRDLIDISPTLTEAAGAIVDVSSLFISLLIYTANLLIVALPLNKKNWALLLLLVFGACPYCQLLNYAMTVTSKLQTIQLTNNNSTSTSFGFCHKLYFGACPFSLRKFTCTHFHLVTLILIFFFGRILSPDASSQIHQSLGTGTFICSLYGAWGLLLDMGFFSL